MATYVVQFHSSTGWTETGTGSPTTAGAIELAKKKGNGKYRILRVVQEFNLETKTLTRSTVTRLDEPRKRVRAAKEVSEL